MKHRHFVALPLLLAVILVSLLGIRDHGTSELLLTSSLPRMVPEGHFFLGSGVSGEVFEGGKVEEERGELQLLEGSLLLHGEGKTKLQAGSFELLGVSGVFFASLQGGNVTVAALSSPVLAKGQSGDVLVPVGMQWRSSLPSHARSLSLLPGDFLTEQHRKLRGLLVQAPKLPSLRKSLLPPLASLSFLALPKSREGASSIEARNLVAHLEDALEEEDLHSFEEVTKDPVSRDLLGSHDDSLSLLLPKVESHPGIESSLLSLVTSGSSENFLLLSVHPKFRNRMWMLPPPPSLSLEQSILRLFAFPLSDRMAEAASPLALEKWREEVRLAVRRAPDPVILLEDFLEVLYPCALDMEAKGYPERAQRLSEHLLALSEPFKFSLSPVSAQHLADLAEIPSPRGGGAQFPLPAGEGVKPRGGHAPLRGQGEGPGGGEPFDPAAVEADSYSLLHNAGALFRYDTAIEAVTPDEVSVTSIVFPGADGSDRLFDFTLQFPLPAGEGKGEGPYQLQTTNYKLEPEEGQGEGPILSSILENGTPLPFPVSLNQFIEWLGMSP